jgi:hypothetical protein
MSRVVAPLVLVVAAAACSLYHTHTLRFDQAVRPVTVPDSVRVLGQEPGQPYRVVALISVTTDYGLAYGPLARRLAQEAAKLGGHAVLLGPESVSSNRTQTTLTAKVLVYDEPAVGGR